MIDELKRKFYTLCAEWKYRNVTYDEVCCCGLEMDKHTVLDNHSPRCAKEYAVTCYVESKVGKEIV